MEVSHGQLTQFLESRVLQAPPGHNFQLADYTALRAPAVDHAGPYETDDAFSVDCSRRGAFLVRVFIADGSQLAHHAKVFADAALKGESSYGPQKKDVDPLYPEPLIRQYELPGRSLVLTRTFNADAVPTGKVAFELGLVRTVPMTPDTFIRRYGPSEKREAAPVVAFATKWAQRMSLRHGGRLGPQNDPAKFGMAVVQTYNTLVNLSANRLAVNEGIPLLNRAFNPSQLFWNERRGQYAAYAVYASSRSPHHGIRRNMAVMNPRVSAPMRRWIDTFNHIQIGLALQGTEPPFSVSDTEEIADCFNFMRLGGEPPSLMTYAGRIAEQAS